MDEVGDENAGEEIVHSDDEEILRGGDNAEHGNQMPQPIPDDDDNEMTPEVKAMFEWTSRLQTFDKMSRLQMNAMWLHHPSGIARGEILTDCMSTPQLALLAVIAFTVSPEGRALNSELARDFPESGDEVAEVVHRAAM